MGDSSIIWTVRFAAHQALPDGYGVEAGKDEYGFEPTLFWGFKHPGAWIGPNRRCRWDARRDVLAYLRGEIPPESWGSEVP